MSCCLLFFLMRLYEFLSPSRGRGITCIDQYNIFLFHSCINDSDNIFLLMYRMHFLKCTVKSLCNYTKNKKLYFQFTWTSQKYN